MTARTALLAAGLGVVGLLGGCRGGTSEKPPVHLVLDMDFQRKLKAQSESTFENWTDHRGMRPPVGYPVSLAEEGGALTVARGSFDGSPAAMVSTYDADGDGRLDRIEARNTRFGRIFALADANADGGVDADEATRVARLFSHRDAAGKFKTENPLEATEEVLLRGRERFNVTCATCHGRAGKGGIVAKRWPVPVPDLVEHPDAETRARLIGLTPGEIFDTITNGKGTMPSYAKQIHVEDRWAIAHYLKALQNHFN